MTKNNNALFCISPYVHEGMWVFDDETKGLDKEPFVFGADTLLDKVYEATKDGDGAWDVLGIIFTKHKLPVTDDPGDHIVIERKSEDPTGLDGTHWEVVEASALLGDCLGHKLWLCPALYEYYNSPPKELRIMINRREGYKEHPYLRGVLAEQDQ